MRGAFASDLVRDRAARRLEAAGLRPLDAATVAGVLLDADERGHPSHGLSLLPVYLERLRQGGIRADARPSWVSRFGAVSVLDADGAAGQVAARMAAEACAQGAHEGGVAAVAVRNNNHVGMLAAYRGPFQAAGVAGLLLNVAGPSVAPPGGRRATLGNNALCLVSPTVGPGPFVIDMATGTVACGKIREAAAQGVPVPSGWLLDRDGRPTTDPHALDDDGAVPVFGGHKGLGVSLIVDLLAGALAGLVVSPEVGRQRAAPERTTRCGQLMIGLSPRAFGADLFDDAVRTLERAVRAAYDVPPGVYFPEQQEAAACPRPGYVRLRPGTAAAIGLRDG